MNELEFTKQKTTSTEYEDNRPTTPSEQMIGDDYIQSNSKTPRSYAGKRIIARSPRAEVLDPMVLAAIRHYKMCETCGNQHDKTECPYQPESAPSVSWVNKIVTQKRLSSQKRPKVITELAKEIECNNK